MSQAWKLAGVEQWMNNGTPRDGKGDDAMKKTKTKAQTATVQEMLGVDPDMSDRDVAVRLYLQVGYLAAQLARHGIKPEDELCQHVPDRDCSKCAGDLPWCWVVASGDMADAAAGS